MSDQLKSVFKIPKETRDRMIEGTKDAKKFLDNAALLKSLGLMSEKDEGDMKTLIDMSEKIEAITSEAETPTVPEE